MVFVVFFKGYS